MEFKDFSDYVMIFFQYGPFAILPYLMIFALPRLYKRLKSAPDVLKPVLKRNIWMYQLLIVVLIIFCVGFWMSYLSGPKFFYGDVVDFPTAEYVLVSPDLHLRTITTARESTILWIWQKAEGQEDAKICFFRGSAGQPEKSFYLYSDALKSGLCRLVYDREDGELYFGKDPLPTKRKIVSREMPQNTGFGFLTLYADQQPDPEYLLMQLQSLDFSVRGRTVEMLLEKAEKDQDFVNAVLHSGFVLLRESRAEPYQYSKLYNRELLLSSLLTLANSLHREPWTHFDHWMELLGDEGLDLIVTVAGLPEPYIQNMALEFMFRFQDELVPMIEPKIQSEEYRRNEAYIRGALNFTGRLPGSREYLQELQQQDWVRDNQRYKDTVDRNIEQMAMPETDDLGLQLSRVIDLAWELKARNVRYAWGGKSEDEGFDSAGFVGYILTRAEVRQAMGVRDPELWRVKILRSEVGERRPENRPHDVGDLVFYMDGFVMLYLGEGRVIGMTERGMGLHPKN